MSRNPFEHAHPHDTLALIAKHGCAHIWCCDGCPLDAVCGNPLTGEDPKDIAKRRLGTSGYAYIVQESYGLGGCYAELYYTVDGAVEEIAKRVQTDGMIDDEALLALENVDNIAKILLVETEWVWYSTVFNTEFSIHRKSISL